MAEKRVSVRLAVVGGREVRAELQGIGDAGEQGFRRLSREMDAANSRVAAFYRRVQIAAAAAATAFAAGAAVMIRSGLQVVDAQAKLAQSLGTTVESIQVLERAGELAGVSMSGIEQATKDLTRRLSQAAAGTGPAVAALERLGLSASALLALPLDERVGRINQAIEDFVPAAERAAVAGQLFGEEGSIAISRIDTTTLRQATQDVRDFGVVVSEQDADQIERTNDAISRLGLIWRGLSNQLAVAAAPALEAVADALAAISRSTGPLGQAIRRLFDNIGRLASIAAAFAAFIAGRWVAGMVVAAASVRGLATALVFLRGALIRTGIGA
ncbi:MAG TPA: phage tail tape-measure protein, partial [Acidobacteria bacterium]|nr:phage tail tape-measure protein [Acidobacteriota bacterium]